MSRSIKLPWHYWDWVAGLTRGLATLCWWTRTRLEDLQASVGSKSKKWYSFAFSDSTLLDERHDGHVRIRLELCTSYSCSCCHHLHLSFNEIQNGDSLVLAYQGCCEKWLLNVITMTTDQAPGRACPTAFLGRTVGDNPAIIYGDFVCLGFNGTFSTNRLYCAIKVGK